MPQKTLHNLLWLGGIVFGLLPFILQHKYGGSSLSLYLGENYFGSHILIALSLAALGSTLWGGLSRWLYSEQYQHTSAIRWMSISLCLLVTIITLGCLNLLAGYSYLIAGFSAILFVAIGSVRISHHPSPSLAELRKIHAWLFQKKPWNGPFFLALYTLLLWHNFQLVTGMNEIGGWHMFSLFINRIFTQLTLTGLLYFVVQFSIETGPRWSRPWIWFIVSIAPVTIIIDLLMHGFWNQTFLDFTNNLGADGLLNFEKELKGGGIKLPLSGVLAIAASIILLFGLITYLSSRLARKWKFHTAPIWMLAIMTFGFAGSTAEQAIGKSWKSRRNWMQEYTEFDLLISPVRPPKGLAQFDLKFREHHWLEHTSKLEVTRTPDIYLVLIESFRRDSLKQEITPFLAHFAEHEAQPINHTWAASNGTHLSWFSTFSGLGAIQRETNRDKARASSWPGLKSFHLLKDAGYTLSMHGASDLSFRDIGPHFFGEKDSPFQQVRENIESDPIFDLHLSEREKILFDDLKSKLDSRPSGAHLDILTIDSTHYQYTWHPDFTPPFPDYYPHSFFPATPSKEDIRLIKNQYFNSLAWADHLAEDFCNHLKSKNRYDDSIIIFLGDHGEEFQDHGGWLHVSSLEDEQVKVPMLVKWPKSNGRGPALNEVSQLDLLPSILDYLKGESTQELDTAGNTFLTDSNARTSIITTAQGGITGESMLLTRDGYKAYFTWPRYFDGRPSSTATLTRLVSPKSDIIFETKTEYDSALKKHFPDAFERFFETFTLTPQKKKKEK